MYDENLESYMEDIVIKQIYYQKVRKQLSVCHLFFLYAASSPSMLSRIDAMHITVFNCERYLHPPDFIRQNTPPVHQCSRKIKKSVEIVDLYKTSNFINNIKKKHNKIAIPTLWSLNLEEIQLGL